MRPRRLVVRGFTCFRDEVSIDFTDLQLFAITGPTHAGFLPDGRVLLTFRSHIGRSALWAWIGDPLEKPRPPLAGHRRHEDVPLLENDALHRALPPARATRAGMPKRSPGSILPASPYA